MCGSTSWCVCPRLVRRGLRCAQTAGVVRSLLSRPSQVAKAEVEAQIETAKFKQLVKSITPETIRAMAEAGPETQAKLLQGAACVRSTYLYSHVLSSAHPELPLDPKLTCALPLHTQAYRSYTHAYSSSAIPNSPSRRILTCTLPLHTQTYPSRTHVQSPLYSQTYLLSPPLTSAYLCSPNRPRPQGLRCYRRQVSYQPLQYGQWHGRHTWAAAASCLTLVSIGTVITLV